jgi:hypothetical protein
MLPVLTRTVRVDPYLLTHEIVEKALLDELRLHYLHVCQIERDAVKATGVPWWVYQRRFMKKYEKPIEEEKLVRVPPRLTPYKDEKDFGPVTAPRAQGGVTRFVV